MKKPSLRDIALESGVSFKTVSRILRGETENHRKRTCEQVWAVANRLQYRPNLAAGAVFGRKTKTVGIMIPFGYEIEILALNGEQFKWTNTYESYT
jgi:DNA-binding LacI/PurR family transcriptional regulator